ncbi:MAG: hypothetical protein EBU34_13480, partial [Alphaproteobacteria bacterium]|nr:hypothetical protein [Alphaproteobacteria bacterium]
PGGAALIGGEHHDRVGADGARVDGAGRADGHVVDVCTAGVGRADRICRGVDDRDKPAASGGRHVDVATVGARRDARWRGHRVRDGLDHRVVCAAGRIDVDDRHRVARLISHVHFGADDDVLDYSSTLVSGRTSAFSNPVDSSNTSLNQTADDAQAKVDGIVIKSKTNNFLEAIPGLSFEVLKTDATGVASTLTVRDNRETVKERIRKFAADMTALNQRLIAMTKPGSKDEKAGPLAGNSGILSLSSAVSGAYGTGFKITATNTQYSWSQVGLEWNRSGAVTVRESDLSNAVDGLIGTAMLGGFTSSIKSVLAQFRGVAGSLQASIDVLQNNRSRLSSNIDDLQSRLEKTRAKLVSKYAALDAKLVSMNQMSSNVRSSLAGLQ